MQGMSKAEYLETVYQYATSQLRANKTQEEVIEELIEEGLDPREARDVVKHLIKLRQEDAAREIRMQMWRSFGIAAFFLVVMIACGLVWGQAAQMIGLAGLVYGLWEAGRLYLQEQATRGMK